METLLLLFIISLFVIILLSNTSSTPIKEHYVGTRRVADELDQKRAVKDAVKTICLKKGYSWYEMGDEFTYDCKHTKSTCLRDSIYPTPKDAIPQYYEWRDASHKDAKEAGINTAANVNSSILSASFADSTNIKTVETVNREGGVCIMGNEYLRSTCEDEKLTYNTDTGECKTNYNYCQSKMLPFCNGDCFMDPTMWINDKIFGSTFAKMISFVTPSRLITELACPPPPK